MVTFKCNAQERLQAFSFFAMSPEEIGILFALEAWYVASDGRPLPQERERLLMVVGRRENRYKEPLEFVLRTFFKQVFKQVDTEGSCGYIPKDAVLVREGEE